MSSEFCATEQEQQPPTSMAPTVWSDSYPRSTTYPHEPCLDRVPMAYAALASPFGPVVSNSVNMPHVAYAAPIDPYMKGVSDHVIQQEITS